MNGDVLLNQEFHASGLKDMTLPKEGLLGPGGPLTLQEIGETRRPLGELQWLATQTDLLFGARVCLLMMRCVEGNDASVLKEIHELVTEARHSTLQTVRIVAVKGIAPEDLCVCVFGHAAHMDRSKAGSTGGMLAVLAPQLSWMEKFPS